MAAKRQLLIADDEPAILDIMEGNLACPAWDIETATNAFDALLKARDLRPFLVITDVQMASYGKGTDMIRALRLEKAIANTPIIVLTGMDLERVKKLVAPDDSRLRLLNKPPDFAQIFAAIKELTGVDRDSVQ